MQSSTNRKEHQKKIYRPTCTIKNTTKTYKRIVLPESVKKSIMSRTITIEGGGRVLTSINPT